MTAGNLLAVAACAQSAAHRPADNAPDADVAGAVQSGGPGRDDPWAAIELAPPAPDERPLRRARSATAASPAGSDTQRTGAVWSRTLLALGGVVTLILLLALGYRALAGAGGKLALAGRSKNPGLVQVISRTALSPRQSLHLVRVGPRLVLVGMSNDRLSALDVIDDADLTARIVGQAAGKPADSQVARFQHCLEREARDYGGAPEGLDETCAPEDVRLLNVKRALARTARHVRNVIARA